MDSHASDTSMTGGILNLAAAEAQSHDIEERVDSKFSFFFRVLLDAHYAITNTEIYITGTNLWR